jgi:cytochrome c-type biogenesis protein CcsB
VRHLGAFVIALVLMLLGVAGSLLYTDAAPLMPALNSYWIKIHVPCAVAASGIFMVGFVIAALYLIRQRYDARLAAGKPLRFPVTLGPRLPEAASLERLTFRFHAIAFPIWTVAIILGALWAESAWSRYWGWDPKETWAFVSWVVYAAYLHARATTGWRGARATWIAVLGWATMMVNLFAINLVTSGLHSYSGLN